MAQITKLIMILSLVLLTPIGFVNANTNQYGSKYDEKLPLKSISYLFETAEINGKTFSFQGVITSQCQGDACWLKLKDSTGEVLVDLKPYDFRVPLGLVGKNVKMNGRANTLGEGIQIDAISIIIE